MSAHRVKLIGMRRLNTELPAAPMFSIVTSSPHAYASEVCVVADSDRDVQRAQAALREFHPVTHGHVLKMQNANAGLVRATLRSHGYRVV